MIVSFDIDGVIAAITDADFNPKRTVMEYYNKPVHPSLDLSVLNRMIANYQVYFISARSFKDALSCTRRWLFNVGVNVEDSMGVLCAEGAPGQEATAHKIPVIEWLGSALHIDDHAKVIPPLGKRGCLFLNQNYVENVELYDKGGDFYTAKDFGTIERIARELYVKRGYC